MAAHALRNAGAILDRNRRIVEEISVVVESFMAEFEELFEYRRPDGGCVAFPRYRGDDGVENFCRRAVEEDGVFLAPASIYRSDLEVVPTDRFRIGIGRRNVPESLDRLRQHLAARVS